MEAGCMFSNTKSKMEDGANIAKMPKVLRPAERFENFHGLNSRIQAHALQGINQGIIVDCCRKILHPFDFHKKPFRLGTKANTLFRFPT